MVAPDPLAAERELVARPDPLAVGQEGVVADRGRQRALGHAEHDDQVEVEADGVGQRPDEDALAQPADPAEVGVELELERAPEDVERGGLVDGVERGQAVEPGVDGVGRPDLVGRPVLPAGGPAAADDPVGERAQPRHPLGPRCGTRLGVGERVDDRQHEPAQVAGALGLPAGHAHTAGQLGGGGRLGVVGGVEVVAGGTGVGGCAGVVAGCAGVVVGAGGQRGGPFVLGLVGSEVLLSGQAVEQPVPVGTARDHAGLAGRALPRGHRGAGAARGPGQHPEHVGPAEAVVGQGQQVDQRAPHHAGGERPDGRAVAGHAGGRQVLVHEAPVGLVGPVQDGDALERGAVERGPHHVADGGPDLVVGVGGAEDLRAPGGDRQRHRHRFIGGGECGAEACQRAVDAGVGVVAARHAHHDRGRPFGRDGGQQRGLAAQQVLREIHHDVAQLGGQAPARVRGQGGHRRVGEVGLVVPAAVQPGAGLAAEAHDVVRAPPRTCELGQAALAGVGQLGERGHQRRLGGRVLGHRGEDAGVGPQLAPQGGGDHRRRHRPPAGRGQPGRAQQLGQPVGGEEGHRGHPRARPTVAQAGRGQGPAGGHAHVVGGHDHGHGRERDTVLGGGHGGAQTGQRRAAVRGGEDLEGHSSKGTPGV